MRLRRSYLLLLPLLLASSQASARAGLRETFGPGRDGPAGGIGRGDELQRKAVDLAGLPAGALQRQHARHLLLPPRLAPAGRRQARPSSWRRRAGILALGSPRRTTHEPAGFTPGAFAPTCREHDELRNEGGVYDTAWRGDRPLGMFAVFRAWAAGASPAILAAESEADSVCPGRKPAAR